MAKLYDYTWVYQRRPVDVHKHRFKLKWSERDGPVYYSAVGTVRRTAIYNPIREWCIREFDGADYYRWHGSCSDLWFQFRDEQDAFMFRIKWC